MSHPLLVNIVAVAGPLLLLLLTGIAGYSYSQICYLSLPIPQALGLFTVVLPLITWISQQGAYGLIRRSSRNEQYQLTIPLIAVIGFQLIYETIVATLALTYILPPSSLECGLDLKWQKLVAANNVKAIKAIQDAFDCCGFRHVKDRAWPLPGQHHSPCGETFGRNDGCLGAWRKAEQIDAGLFVLVAVVVFVIKVLTIIFLFTSSSWIQARWANPFQYNASADPDATGSNNSVTTRLIED